jgi:hypothetical protein
VGASSRRRAAYIHQQQAAAIPRPEQKAGQPHSSDEERVLRAKYLDWCSAQVADHFLALSPAEIFEMAERAARDSEVSRLPSSWTSGEVAADLHSYRKLVERVTEVLWQQLELPSFEEWEEQNRRNPEAIDEQLLGFWRDEA